MSAPASRRKQVLSWGLALAALGFVVYAVPIRDQCADPAAHVAQIESKPLGPKVAVSREDDACILHRSAGVERLTKAECASLTCEPGLWSTLAAARIGVLLPLLLVYIAGTFAWAMRWRALLTLAGVTLSPLSVWRVTLEAQAGGIILPGGFGGDALRVAFVVGKGASTPIVVASVLLDRVLGLVTLATIAAGLALTLGGGLEGLLRDVTYVFLAIPIGFVAGILVLRLAHARGLGRAPFMQRGVFASVVNPVLEYVGDRRAPWAITRGLLISLVVSAVQLVAIRGAIYALGVTPSPERWVYIGTTLSFMVAVIPALPGGWGTSDLAFIKTLGWAGLAPSTALAVSMLYRLFWYSTGGLGAVLFLMRSSRKTQVPAGDVAAAPAPRVDPS